MTFNHEKFFIAYSAQFGRPNASQRAGLEQLLTFFEADAAMTDLRWIAYALATVWHECARTWLPIEEYGKGKGYSYGKPVAVKMPDGKTRPVIYYGRGYVQLTWQANYEKMDAILRAHYPDVVAAVPGFDLVLYPEQVLIPAVAYAIMSHGMIHGTFTGVGLGHYINSARCVYVMARKIINGVNEAHKIAGYAVKFETVLREAQ